MSRACRQPKFRRPEADLPRQPMDDRRPRPCEFSLLARDGPLGVRAAMKELEVAMLAPRKPVAGAVPGRGAGGTALHGSFA